MWIIAVHKLPGLNRRDLEHERKTAPRAARGSNRQADPRSARGAGHVYGALTNREDTETKLTVALDTVKFTEADRKAQYEAAMKVHALFGEESALMDRILALRGSLAKAGGALPEGDALRKAVMDFDGKVDAVRKQIVATTEGGAITGEER